MGKSKEPTFRYCEWIGRQHKTKCSCRRFTYKQFLALVAIRYDTPPNCKCDKRPVPVCTIGLRPCWERRETGSCSCTVAAPPCKHVLAQEINHKALEIIVDAFPEEYYPNLKEPEPAIALTREDRVALYAERFHKKYKNGKGSRIFCKSDILKEDDLAVKGDGRSNGVHKNELVIYRRSVNGDTCSNGSISNGPGFDSQPLGEEEA